MCSIAHLLTHNRWLLMMWNNCQIAFATYGYFANPEVVLQKWFVTVSVQYCSWKTFHDHGAPTFMSCSSSAVIGLVTLLKYIPSSHHLLSSRYLTQAPWTTHRCQYTKAARVRQHDTAARRTLADCLPTPHIFAHTPSSELLPKLPAFMAINFVATK